MTYLDKFDSMKLWRHIIRWIIDVLNIDNMLRSTSYVFSI